MIPDPGSWKSRDIRLNFSIDADCEKRRGILKLLLENCEFRFIIIFKASEGFNAYGLLLCVTAEV